jgi:hypothetical protein
VVFAIEKDKRIFFDVQRGVNYIILFLRWPKQDSTTFSFSGLVFKDIFRKLYAQGQNELKGMHDYDL